MIKIRRLIKQSNTKLKKAVCKIDNNQVICEVVNENYSNNAIEVTIVEGNHIGLPAIVEKDNIMFMDEPLKINYEVTKNEVFKLMMKEEIDDVVVELRHYYDEYNKSFLVAVINYNEGETLDVAYSTELLTCDDNTIVLKKEQDKMAKKISNWLNNNYTVRIEEVNV